MSHNVLQYVDDSSNSIGGETVKKLIHYTENYMTLLKQYYSENKLKIDETKMSFMMVCISLNQKEDYV